MYEAPINTVDQNHPEIQAYQPDFVLFRDAKGQSHRVEHPAIIDDLIGSDLNQNIRVGLDGHIETMSLADYLFMIGLTHSEYLGAIEDLKNKRIGASEMFRQMHQKVIDRRIDRAIGLQRQYAHDTDKKRVPGGAGSVVRPDFSRETQTETAVSDSKFFVGLIRDLRLDGLDAMPADQRDDYLGGIDEYIVFDPLAYETQGEQEGQKIYIGIQRSFSVKELKNRFAMLPESPGKGLIFKVFLHEKIDDYQDADGTRLWQKLLEERTRKARAAGLSPMAYAQKFPSSQGIPPVDRVLPGGQVEQHRRVVKILKEIQKQYRLMLKEPNSDFDKLPPHWKKVFEQNFDNLPIQDIVDELTKK